MARAAGTLLAVAAVALLGALTRAPVSLGDDDRARIRLSWRVRSEQVGACVRPTEEELQRLPPHMRNPDACVGDVPPFRLRVEVDGRTTLEDEVLPGGARGDRPVYVFREVEVEPGERDLLVEFVQREPPAPRGDGTEGDPLELQLAARADLAPGEIVLVTLNPETGQLVLRRRPPGAGGEGR